MFTERAREFDNERCLFCLRGSPLGKTFTTKTFSPIHTAVAVAKPLIYAPSVMSFANTACDDNTQTIEHNANNRLHAQRDHRAVGPPAYGC